MPSAAYPVNEVEGIGPAMGAKLKNAKITTTYELLDRCCKKSGRRAVAAETGINEKMILQWTNLADLMRVKGIGKQFAELLEAAGVDTVKELRCRNPTNTAAKMAEVNKQKKLAKVAPPRAKVAKWVMSAKRMKPIIEY